jgi:hypothetical protein
MKSQKALLICPNFRGYEKEIKRGLEDLGYTVKAVFYEEDAHFNLPIVIKIILRLFASILQALPINDLKTVELHSNFRQYFLSMFCFPLFNKFIIESTYGKFEKTLIIKGFGINKNTLCNIDSTHKFLYQWDSLVRYSSIKPIYKYLSNVYTFDKSDADNGFGCYLPNFFVRDADYSCSEVINFKYDVLFVGMYTKYRLDNLQKIVEHCNKNGLRHFIKLYRPRSKFVSKKSYSDPLIIDSLINANEYSALLNESKSVIEVSHIGQAGMTQRVLDALDKNKLIICFDAINELDDFPNRTLLLSDFLQFNKKDFEESISYLFAEEDKKNSFITEYELDNWLQTILHVEK